MAVEITVPFQLFFDNDGMPLEDGYIYIGVQSLNPETDPLVVYWDEALTIPAAQPIRTLNGYPSRIGTPARLFVNADRHSITVKNKNGVLMYSDLNSSMMQNAAQIAGGNQVVGSIAALRLLSKDNPSQAAFVTGYYAPGDGGGGNYYHDAADTLSADNGGTVIVAADGGRWKLSFNGKVTLRQFGAVGDAVTDDTAEMQAALTAAQTQGFTLFIDAGQFRSTAPLLVTSGISIDGVMPMPYQGTLGVLGNGAWLFFDHAGIGISIGDGTLLGTAYLNGFGTYRSQPAAAPGWMPGAFDFDISIIQSDVIIGDLMLLNPTKGIRLRNGSYGRLAIGRLRGQPMTVGLDIDQCFDAPQIDTIHFWPFWQDEMDIHDYTIANLSAIKFARVDNPVIKSLFCIFAFAGIHITQSADGTANKWRINAFDADRGKYGVYIDNTVGGSIGYISSMSTLGESGVSGSTGIIINGNSCTLSIGTADIRETTANGVRVDGTSNVVTVAGLRISNYDVSSLGFAAVECTSGTSAVYIANRAIIGTTGIGPIYSAVGEIVAPLTDGNESTSTNGAGDVVVTHGAGITPNNIYVQNKTLSPLFWSVTTKSATQFTVRFWNSAGAALASSAVDFSWRTDF